MHILGRGLEELLAIAIAAEEGAAANAAAARGLRTRTESIAIVCPEEPQALKLGVMLTQKAKIWKELKYLHIYRDAEAEADFTHLCCTRCSS